VRYEERGQWYRDVEKVGKHCFRGTLSGVSIYIRNKNIQALQLCHQIG